MITPPVRGTVTPVASLQGVCHTVATVMTGVRVTQPAAGGSGGGGGNGGTSF